MPFYAARRHAYLPFRPFVFSPNAVPAQATTFDNTAISLLLTLLFIKPIQVIGKT